MREVYLDNSATTRVSEEAAKAVYEVMTSYYGNPSSLHKKGIEAERLLTDARETIAKGLGVTPGEIYFTSGGTESNNIAIKGTAYALRRFGKHIITTKVEHPSVLETCKQLEREGYTVTYLEVGSDGTVNLEALERALTPDTILVSIMYVNNEVGAIEPIEQTSKLIKNNKNTIFHVDAVQAFGKIKLVPKVQGIDLLSASSHKIYGPKGVGCLFVRQKVKITPIINGGGQENGLRSGTENLPGIVGFGVAARQALENLDSWHEKMAALKRELKEGILTQIPDTVVNGPEEGAPHILNISFLGCRGEIILHALEAKGIYVSTGSACSSRKTQQSHVLRAMHKNDQEIEGAVRFSLSPFLEMDDIHYTIEVLKNEIKEIRKFTRR